VYILKLQNLTFLKNMLLKLEIW